MNTRSQVRNGLRAGGKWIRTKLVEKDPQGARLLPAELDIGEQLSLLVALVGARVQPLYNPDPLEPFAPRPHIAMLKPPLSPPSAKYIVIAPFSNSRVRDWPLDRYKRLVGPIWPARFTKRSAPASRG